VRDRASATVTSLAVAREQPAALPATDR